MTERYDAIVIGAGHNGLVCSTYLARAGRNVLCVDAQDAPGGMAAPRRLAGDYCFAGLAHTANPVCASIRADLELERFGYAPGAALDTIALDAHGRHLAFAAAGVSGAGLPEGDAAAYPAFRRRYRDFARALQPLFDNKPPRLKHMEPGDRGTLARLGWNLRMRLGREAMYEFLRVAAMNIYDVLEEAFDDERLCGALAADAVCGSAMGPRTPGSVLTWLKRLYDEQGGAAGMLSANGAGLVSALAQSAHAAGVTLRCNARVAAVLTEAGTVTGIQLDDGTTFRADVVVSNADPRATFLDLVGAPRLDAMFASRVAQIRGAGTVAKLHLGLSGLPEFAGLEAQALGQRLLVAPSMRYVERAFNHSKYGEYSAQPVLEITLPSVHDATLAPPGHHVMSVAVSYVPYALHGGWQEQKQALADAVVAQLAHYAPQLESLIVAREFLTPADIEEQYGAVQGHWHHGELSLHQSFMMRPLYGAARYDTPLAGLFLCGAGCHPGGGLNGLPGRNAARRVLERGAAS